MENASKALIIAGAILLSILIIAIGMYIYNSSTNSIQNAAGQISQQDISAFNNQLDMYSDRQVGTNVKALITTMASICKENAEEETKLPDLFLEPTNGGTVIEVKPTVADGTMQSAFNKAKAKVEARHYYNVVVNTCPETGLIDSVVIEYEKGSLLSEDLNELDSTYAGNDH